MLAQAFLDFLLAACLTGVALAAFHYLAPFVGLLDTPHGRKTHDQATPLTGGIAIAVGVLLTLLVVAWLRPEAAPALAVLRSRLGFILGVLTLIILGVLDDRRPIPASAKLVIQLVCCLAAVFIDHVAIGEIGITVGPVVVSLGPFLVPFTILVMLTIINAINMIDGVDGLAAGSAFAIFVLIAKAALAGRFLTDALILCALLGGLGAFLLVNFPLLPGSRAKAFLGDAGSLALGFALAYFAVYLSALPHRVFRPSTALWFFFIPVADAVLLYIRRTIRDRSPFSPGRDHIHHLLLEHMSARAVAWLLVAATAGMAALAYLAERLGVPPIVHVVTWIGLFLLYAAITQGPWIKAWENGRRNHPPS